MHEQKTISALSQAIVQGCCRRIKGLELSFGEKNILTHERLSLLVGAVELDGALAGLTALSLRCNLPPGGLPMLARTLAGGAAPLLRTLKLYGIAKLHENDMDSLATMLEARARIPWCKRLSLFAVNDN